MEALTKPDSPYTLCDSAVSNTAIPLKKRMHRPPVLRRNRTEWRHQYVSVCPAKMLLGLLAAALGITALSPVQD